MTDSTDPTIQLGANPPTTAGEHDTSVADSHQSDVLVGHVGARLVQALAGIRALAPSSTRTALRDELSRRFRDVDLRDHDLPKDFFAQVVLRCSRMRGGLAELSILVELFAAGDPDGALALRLIDELGALAIEPSLVAVWGPLRAELELIPLRHAQPLIVAATGGRSPVFPAHSQDTWAVFIHLVGHNVPAGGLFPPWLTFMELVRDRFTDEATAILVRDLARRLARARGWTAELERARTRHDAQTPPVVRMAFLAIVLAPDQQDLDLFIVHSVQRWDEDLVTPVRSADVLSPRARLTAVVERLISAAEEHCAAMSVELRIEFVLPLALINEPVEWWPKDSREQPPSTLSVYHQVVLRSYERLHRPAWHRVWLSRWRQLQDSTSVRAFWADSAGEEDHARRLEAALRINDNYVAVVLSRPPHSRAGHEQELVVALRAGIPLIVWHRTGEPSPEARQIIADLISDPRSAPELLSVLRAESEQLSPARRDVHPARNLSILWDDAESALPVAQAGSG
jgi:hypothetical protein